MNDQKHSMIVVDRDIAEQLREVGITPTQQRVQIAEILFARPQHLSADQILAVVNSNGPIASKATIYNTLGLFARMKNYHSLKKVDLSWIKRGHLPLNCYWLRANKRR